MARALYMDDSYLKSWNTKVVGVSDSKYVILVNLGMRDL